MIASLERLKTLHPVAYFSMEVAVDPAIPSYSGGLGILAGDTVRAAADLGIPFVTVTLLSRKGYFRQVLGPKGDQSEEPVRWSPSERLTLLPETATVFIEGRPVVLHAWVHECTSFRGHAVPVLFLDADVDGNDPRDRSITDTLYGGDAEHRLKQEMLLGIGGVRMLGSLSITPRK
jgi:glycogen phosphorylase